MSSKARQASQTRSSGARKQSSSRMGTQKKSGKTGGGKKRGSTRARTSAKKGSRKGSQKARGLGKMGLKEGSRAQGAAEERLEGSIRKQIQQGLKTVGPRSGEKERDIRQAVQALEDMRKSDRLAVLDLITRIEYEPKQGKGQGSKTLTNSGKIARRAITAASRKIDKASGVTPRGRATPKPRRRTEYQKFVQEYMQGMAQRGEKHKGKQTFAEIGEEWKRRKEGREREEMQGRRLGTGFGAAAEEYLGEY